MSSGTLAASGALLLGYRLFDLQHFEDNQVPPTWSVTPALQLQLHRHVDSGSLVFQVIFVGGPGRYDSDLSYIAVPLRIQTEVGWRMDMQRGQTQFRWELGTGLHFARLSFVPDGIWNNWMGWGLGVYTAPSLRIGSEEWPVMPVLSLYVHASAVPTGFYGEFGLNNKRIWHWDTSTVGAAALLGFEWGKRSAQKVP